MSTILEITLLLKILRLVVLSSLRDRSHLVNSLLRSSE